MKINDENRAKEKKINHDIVLKTKLLSNRVIYFDILNIILIRKLGAIGASIGTVIAEFTVTSIQIYFTRDDFELKEVIKLSKNYAFSAIIMFMVCLILRHMINSNFISVVVQVIVGAMTYGVILLLMKDKFVKEFINKILKRSK